MDLDSLMAQALTIGVDAVILESHRNWVDNSPHKEFATQRRISQTAWLNRNPLPERTGGFAFPALKLGFLCDKLRAENRNLRISIGRTDENLKMTEDIMKKTAVLIYNSFL